MIESLSSITISASLLIFATAVLRRLLLQKLPKSVFSALWLAALARLLIPLRIVSPFGVGAVGQAGMPGQPGVGLGLAEAPGVGEVALAAHGASPLLILWILGGVCCAAFFAVSHLRWRGRYRESLPAESGYVREWLARHPLRRRVQVRQSDRIQAPLTYGLLQPVILLPKAMMGGEEGLLGYVLTHELAHIKRFHILFKYLLAAAACIHWFNPLVWVLYALANRDLELCCDAAVVRSSGGSAKAAYARALIGLEEKKSGFAPLCSSFGKHSIEERVRCIMNYKKYSLVTIVVAVLLVATVTTVFATTKAKAPLSPRQALDQLEQSIHTAGDQVSFTIPAEYPHVEQWNILIAGRMELDGFGGMSVHLFEEENTGHSWVAGKQYTIALDNYTDLLLDASLPNGQGAPLELSVDLLR